MPITVGQYTVSDLNDGTDGSSLYTWIRYADTPTTGINALPTNKAYIGIAVNKTTTAATNTYADYTWSLIKGDTGGQGTQGEPGDDGLPTYLHIAYASSANGATNFHVSDPVGRTYIGVYTDNILADSTSYTAYTWSLIKGDPGAKGDPGDNSISGVLSNDSHTVSTLSDGTGGVYTGAISTMSIYNGATNDSANWAVTVVVSGVTGSLSGKTYTVTNLTADTGYVDFTATRSGYASIVKRFTLTKSKQGATGGGGSAGLPATSYWLVASASVIGKTIAGAFSPTSITITGKSQTGTNAPVNYAGRFIISDSPDGITFTDRYVGTVNEATKTYNTFAGMKAIRVEFFLAGGTTVLLDEQIIPIVSDGATGGTGSPSYLHIAYATSADGSVGFSTTVSTGKTFIGTYSDNTAADSGNYLSYSWSPLKGDKGNDGITTYTWIKYADDSLGNGMADTATGKRWLGIAQNQTTAVESSTASLYQWSPLYDNVTVGGRNFLMESDTVVTTTAYMMKGYNIVEPIADGTEMTISLKGTLGAGKQYFGIYNSGGSVSPVTLYPADRGADGVFRKTFKWVVGGSLNNVLNVYHMASGTIVNSTITWIKLEKGNVATDFTSANEDINGAYITTGSVNANALKANTVIANNITFTGILSGASGTFTGSVVVGTSTDKLSIIGSELISLYNTGYEEITLSANRGKMLIKNRDLTGGSNLVTAELTEQVLAFTSENSSTPQTRATYGVSNTNSQVAARIFSPAELLLDVDRVDIEALDEAIRLDYPTGENAYITWQEGDVRQAYVGFPGNGSNLFTLDNKRTGGSTVLSGVYYRFEFGVAADGWATLQGDSYSIIKFLSTDRIQFRNSADTAYATLFSAGHTTVSKRDYKKNITSYGGNALESLLSTPIREYHYLGDYDWEMKRIGVIVDESPFEIIDLGGEGVDSYSMAAFVWKAVQELTAESRNEIASLKSEILQLKGGTV